MLIERDFIISSMQQTLQYRIKIEVVVVINIQGVWKHEDPEKLQSCSKFFIVAK